MKQLRWLIPIVLTLALVLVPVGVVLAATTQEVTITATPTYVSISNSPSTWPIGTVIESTDYWSSGSAPTFPLDDPECNFTVTNDGSVAEDITITGANFTGGVGWTIAGAVGADTVVLKAGKSGDTVEGDMVTLTTSAQSFITSLSSSSTKKWELKLETGTFTDGVAKSGTVTLTASAS